MKTYFYAVHDPSHKLGVVVASWKEAQNRMGIITSLNKSLGNGGVRCKKFASGKDAEEYMKTGLAPTAVSVTTNGTVIEAYADGSSFDAANGERVAGMGVFFANGSKYNVSEPLMHASRTNNCAELMAIRRALEQYRLMNSPLPLVVLSDSTYARKCLTEWRRGWESSGFRDGTIANRDLIEPLWALLDSFPPHTVEIQWVKGHSGVYGNEQADQLANAGANASANALLGSTMGSIADDTPVFGQPLHPQLISLLAEKGIAP